MRVGGRRGRRHCVAFAIAVAAAWPAGAAAHHSPAHAPSPYDVELEGETMGLRPAGVGTNAPDASAYRGWAKSVFANGAATTTVTATRPSVHLFARVRPNACVGPPEIVIRAGGRTWWSGALDGEGFRWIGVRVSLPAGVHTVEVALTNNVDRWVGPVKMCDRGVLVDHVALVASPFAPDGWRNRPLADDAPIWTEKSALFRDELEDQVADDVAGERAYKSGVWVGTSEWSTPVYTVPFDQPRVRVRAPADRPDLQAQWNDVPLPPGAQPAQPHDGGDRHLLVWQPSTDTLWEFFGLRYHDDPVETLGGVIEPYWSAGFGGRLRKVSASEGHFPGPAVGRGGYGATATAISLLAGMQRIEEIGRALAEPGVGPLDHALDFAVVSPRGRAGWCWPAQRTDSHLTSLAPEAIPAGTRFRIRAGFDVDRHADEHGLHPYAEMIAKTIQRHGMVARDSGPVSGWYAEDPTPTGRTRTWASGTTGRRARSARTACSPTSPGTSSRCWRRRATAARTTPLRACHDAAAALRNDTRGGSAVGRPRRCRGRARRRAARG
jgi:hypothetical protein